MQTMTISNPNVAKDVQNALNTFNMSFDDLVGEAVKSYIEERKKDDLFNRIEMAEEVSDEENAEIAAEIESMTDEDREIVKTETVYI